jgi:propanol-preferring alcohol dehydrogenase
VDDVRHLVPLGGVGAHVVLDLARAGAIHVEVERYSLDEAPEAYRKLHDGTIRGRAVVVPGD